METKTSNPFERAFSDLTKPSVLSAIASVVARNLKGRMVQELAGQASDQIKEIDQTRDLLVQGVYERFRERIKALTENRADGLETLSAALPSPGITHEGTPIMAYPNIPLRPLGYFLPPPESRDAELFLEVNRQIFSNSLTTHDYAALIILCVQESVNCKNTSVATTWVGDEASCWAWDFVGQLTPEAKLRLALDLLNQMVYSGR